MNEAADTWTHEDEEPARLWTVDAILSTTGTRGDSDWSITAFKVCYFCITDRCYEEQTVAIENRRLLWTQFRS